jgi:hypothetical protein
MPPTIPFTVAPALRGTPQGQVFNSPTVTKQAGYTLIFWQLDIPSQADYENTANHVLSQLFVDGVDSASNWNGGPATNKQGVVDPPPSFKFDITNVPVGAVLQVKITVTAPAPFNIGIKNGAVS